VTRTLKNGDVVNLDITTIKDGWHGDTSRMFMVGTPSIQAKRLTELTYECMWKGIAQVKPGATLGDIGHAIQHYAEGNGCSVVREFCGHGIGQSFHEEPQVLHYGKPGSGVRLEPGMIFTIEPMINAGRRDIRMLGDGWTVVTKDHSLSAQWEHTILVTETGYEVLTLSAGSPAAARLHPRPHAGGDAWPRSPPGAPSTAERSRLIETYLAETAAPALLRGLSRAADQLLRRVWQPTSLPPGAAWWRSAAMAAASCIRNPTSTC
jgi:hypothetical protein